MAAIFAISLAAVCGSGAETARAGVPIPGPGQTVTWSIDMSPIQITTSVVIPEGGTVVIDPGVHVEVHTSNSATLFVEGDLLANGTSTDPIVFDAPGIFPAMVDLRLGSFTASFTDFEGQFLVQDSAEVRLADCRFIGSSDGILRLAEVYTVRSFVHLERCRFEQSSMTLTEAVVILENNEFFDSYASILRCETDLTGPNTFVDQPLQIIRESTIQPMLVENVIGRDMLDEPGVRLRGGNFLLGSSVELQNNRYPLELAGGLVPGSVVPTTGNLNNVIDVGSGGFAGSANWSDLGLPYRLTTTAAQGGGALTIDPGVVIEGSTADAGLYFIGTRQLVGLGLPDAPITMRSSVPGQRWDGMLFHTNSDDGPHLEFCRIMDARFGVRSSNNTMYIDSCSFENCGTGANANSFGSIYFGKTLFASNDVGVSMTDLGHPELFREHNPSAFEGNGAAIDAFEFGAGTDARNVWWGDPSGPQDPRNPGGMGDAIIGVGSAGVDFQPFRTTRPQFSDAPPAVRLVQPSRGSGGAGRFLDPGTKLIVRWDSIGDDIAAHRIEFSPDSHSPSVFEEVATLDGVARSYEWAVPNPGFALRNAPQFLRVVAIDDAGQEGFDQMRLTVSSDRIEGELVITTDLTGQVFHSGDSFPDMEWTGAVSDFPRFSPVIVLENDSTGIGGIAVSGRGVFFEEAPNITTDRARLALRVSNNSNDVEWFFADGYFSIRHDPRLGWGLPTVTLDAPVNGISVPGGSIVNLAWSAAASEGLYGFDVSASYDDGRTWHFVAVDLPADARSFQWKLPSSEGIDDVRVRVIARDRRFQNASDDRAFTITPGDVSGSVRGTRRFGSTPFSQR